MPSRRTAHVAYKNGTRCLGMYETVHVVWWMVWMQKTGMQTDLANAALRLDASTAMSSDSRAIRSASVYASTALLNCMYSTRHLSKTANACNSMIRMYALWFDSEYPWV